MKKNATGHIKSNNFLKKKLSILKVSYLKKDQYAIK